MLLRLRGAGVPFAKCEAGGNGSGWTDGFALPTADALRTGQVFCNLYRHWAGAFTLFTADAFALIQTHLKKTETVKQGIKSPQRTEVPAERTGNPHRRP